MFLLTLSFSNLDKYKIKEEQVCAISEDKNSFAVNSRIYKCLQIDAVLRIAVLRHIMFNLHERDKIE